MPNNSKVDNQKQINNRLFTDWIYLDWYKHEVERDLEFEKYDV